jgi:hypothetical protein
MYRPDLAQDVCAGGVLGKTFSEYPPSLQLENNHKAS